MDIWIDNDGCPRIVRDLVFRAAERLRLGVVIVGNSYFKTSNPLFRVVCVETSFDAADHYIAQHIRANDLLITSDVPLASSVVAKGAVAINAKGEVFDAESVAEKLAVRNLMAELRSGADGLKGSGKPYSEGDKKRFASCFDKTLAQLMKKS